MEVENDIIETAFEISKYEDQNHKDTDINSSSYRNDVIQKLKKGTILFL